MNVWLRNETDSECELCRSCTGSGLRTVWSSITDTWWSASPTVDTSSNSHSVCLFHSAAVFITNGCAAHIHSFPISISTFQPVISQSVSLLNACVLGPVWVRAMFAVWEGLKCSYEPVPVLDKNKYIHTSHILFALNEILFFFHNITKHERFFQTLILADNTGDMSDWK